MNPKAILLAAVLVPATAVLVTVASADRLGATPAGRPKPNGRVERGRYLVAIAGCNDCHTPGYDVAGGAVPEADWMVGSPVGWRGPWGTTYPINVRLLVDGLTEDEWLTYAKSTKGAPPMPWWSLHRMADDDLRSIYAFLRALGPKGGAMPSALPPDAVPPPPYLDLKVVLPAPATR